MNPRLAQFEGVILSIIEEEVAEEDGINITSKETSKEVNIKKQPQEYEGQGNQQGNQQQRLL